MPGSRQYFAHSDGSTGTSEWHPFTDHAEGVAGRAAVFLQRFRLDRLVRAWGLLHDVGKVTPEFQDILAGNPRRFDHAAPGGRIAIDRYGRIGRLLAPGIAGHHAGMANWSGEGRRTPLEDRLRCAREPDAVWERMIELPCTLLEPGIAERYRGAFACQLLTRMVFSAGVDADYLDTEAYYERLHGRLRERGGHPALEELSRRLDARLDFLSGADNAMNRLRREVLTHVRRQAGESQGTFTLTVPTGGGKTLTSLAFALDHALRHDLSRVIYVAPFMSIIDQTVEVFRGALQGAVGDAADFVIEHHSTFDEERMREGSSRDRHRLAMENWDAPVVCTTYVQFLESLFSNRPSRCRKLHNVANSVVILDEPQSLPLGFLRPCVAVLDELARVWRTTVVQCTATPPALAASDGFPAGFGNVRELAPDPRTLHECTRWRTRVHVEEVVGNCRTSDGELVDRIRGCRQVLCIVNTRRHARKVREMVGDDAGTFHLSASMCPAHRQAVLRTVRSRLEAGRTVRLIATPVVEAGVDVDFPVVWRALAGLESIIQSAGRCNREGARAAGDVFVFEPEASRESRPPGDVGKRADVARNVIRRYTEDPTSLDAFREYCKDLYWVEGDDALDEKRILARISEGGGRLEFPFETIAEDFELIDSCREPIVAPWDDTARQVLRDLEREPSSGRVARRVQRYVVQISPSARAKLVEDGDAQPFREEEFGRRFVVLSNPDLYRQDVGLVVD